VRLDKRLIGGCEGDLPFMPGSFVFPVAIIDVAKIYTGAIVPNLNGATSANSDVVLFELPTREVGVATGGNAIQVRTAIVTNPHWSPDERQAVLGVMNALGSRMGQPHHWCEPSSHITGRFWRAWYRSGVLLSRRKIVPQAQRLRHAEAPPHLFHLGPGFSDEWRY
jgi:hypothetical protein